MIFAMTSHRVFLDPMLPVPLLTVLGLLIIGLTIYVYLKDRSTVKWLRCLLLIAFRLLAVAGLFLILLNPQREISEPPKQLNKRVIVAVDTSASMAHTDEDSVSRIDEARHHLDRAGLITHGAPTYSGLSFFAFNDASIQITPETLATLSADGVDTRFHRSLSSMLQSAGSGESLAGLILLSDGHDFELVNPARTALEARTRNAPLFALPIGSDQPVRDAAIRIASYQPYVFAGQHARIDAALRLIGCEYEDFILELYREGERIESRKVAVGDELQRLESFEVMEDQPGQYAYELRLSTVRDEVILENNSATTFLNVSNKKINLLLLEGAPYWDTNFTQRSLWGNDKFDIDVAIAVAPNKQRILRKDSSLGVLTLPSTALEFDAYDCVLIGNHVDRLLNEAGQAALVTYVQEYGGNVVFMRGNPLTTNNRLDSISPVTWGAVTDGFSELEINREGRSVAPFELLNLHVGQESLRPILAVQQSDSHSLATVLASARVANFDEPVPTMVHRRSGRGQVLAIASTGLWRTGFNSQINDQSNLFNQFWDNLILWLITSRNVQSSSGYSVLLNTANLALGQTLHIRMTADSAEALPVGVPIEIVREGSQAEPYRTVLASTDSATRLTTHFKPTESGIYRADVPLPDGTMETLRFAVYRNDIERTEVSVDRAYLQKLSDMSGGRLISPDELQPLVEELLRATATEPQLYREPAWDIPLLAWLIALCFATDWILRRRSGLC
jgi:hypothetical protein